VPALFRTVAHIVDRFFVLVILAWILGMGLLTAVSPKLIDVAVTDQTAFLSMDSPSVRASLASARVWPGEEISRTAAVTLTRESGLTAADEEYLKSLESWLNSPSKPDVISHTSSPSSRPEMKASLGSADGKVRMILISFSSSPFTPPVNKAVGDIRARIKATAPEGLSVHVTGTCAVAADQARAINDSVGRTTYITLILIVVILLWVYRSPVAVIVPLMTIVVALQVSTSVVALMAQAGMRVSSMVQNFMIATIFGAGTDYCLFIVSRFKEELGGHPVPPDKRERRRLLAGTVAIVGAVIASSAAAVMVAFASQGVARFGLYRTIGPAMVVAAGVTLLAGLTLTPSLMRLLGKSLFWPGHPERQPMVPHAHMADVEGKL